ncbi:tryptophan-rich sensory protein [Leptolyngbya sp. BL0902]|uniref:tryptophan-rich sensory protein n=1 Tax=Leptolyngbya sp. BL0902 TaxID=1115757 RepID=UPI001CECAF1B|nr:tryptophan-rich sensory protein [Leptolyngbya sp. BL0902]
MPSAPKSGFGLAIATIVAIVATLAVNTLSNLYPPGGQNVGEISNTVLAGVLITPANYAFIIWGVIYLGLLAYAVYQFHPERRTDPQIQRVNQGLILACVAQVIWIFLFTFQWFAASILAMLVILASLIQIYRTLDIGRSRASRQRRWMAHIPFSLYLGWIAVATIVNIAASLYAAGWGGWGISPVAWTVVMMVVAILLGAVVLWQRRDVTFALVFVWALGAIAQRHSDQAALWIAALGGMVLLGLGSLWSLRSARLGNA